MSSLLDTSSARAWASQLHLRYERDGARTRARSHHIGALRVLAALYPEDPAVCHHVLVHPPGGLVGGDTVDMALQLDAGAHALLTTPGATRFYRSTGAPARQAVQARVAPGARLEWLPLETLAYDGCIAENRLAFELDDGAEMIGWDMLALGLPAAGRPLRTGSVVQHVELPGVWLERARLQADDAALLHAPGGLAGCEALGTLWFAAGGALPPARAQALLDAARAAIDEVLQQAPDDALRAGATQPQPRVVVVRALGPRIEPIQRALSAVWRAWRELAWEIRACPPRVWRT